MAINVVVGGGPVEILTPQDQFIGPSVLISNADGKVGFFGAAPLVKQTVTGARDDGTALEDLLEKLAAIGLIVDATTAT